MTYPINYQILSDLTYRVLASYHAQQTELVRNVTLDDVLPNDLYQFVAQKPLRDAGTLVSAWLESWLLASGTTNLRTAIVDVARQLAAKAYGATASNILGIDLELKRNKTNFLICICSNSQLQSGANRHRVTRLLKQVAETKQTGEHDIAGVLGIYDHATQTKYRKSYVELAGEDFWEFVCDEREAGRNILSIMSRQPMEINGEFSEQKAYALNRLTEACIYRLCTTDGSIDWARLAYGRN